LIAKSQNEQKVTGTRLVSAGLVLLPLNCGK